MRKYFLCIALFTFVSKTSYTQEVEQFQSTEDRLSALEKKIEKLEQFKFSGYIQTQWTWNEAEIENGKQNNFSVRRGRLKSAYTNKYGEAVLQIDITENGVDIKDAYFKMREPRFDLIGICAGIFGRPFGYEISYSSRKRQVPERSRIYTTLFPKERDLGAELAFTGPANTFFKDFSLNAGLFAGNGGQAKETDSGKDFIGHLAYQRKQDNISYGIGTSLYAGGVRLAGDDTQKAWKLSDGAFVEDPSLSQGYYAKRQYYGFDGQFSVKSVLGVTSLRGEYLWGVQPGAENGSMSPTGAITSDIYSRNFNGYYIYFVQDIGKSKHSLVAKYDAYDPNTKLSGDNCVTDGDIAYSTYGFGWLFRANANFRVMAFYEITTNEKVNNNLVSTKYAEDIKDNLFTLRLQYVF